MWCWLVTPYAVTAGMTTSALRRLQTAITLITTPLTTTWTTCKAYAGHAIAARPIEIWAIVLLTDAMRVAFHLIQTMSGINRQQSGAKHQPPPLAHTSALRRF